MTEYTKQKLSNKVMVVISFFIFLVIAVIVFIAVRFFIFQVNPTQIVDNNVSVSINVEIFDIITAVFLLLGIFIGMWFVSCFHPWNIHNFIGRIKNPIFARQAIYWIQEKIIFEGWQKMTDEFDRAQYKELKKKFEEVKK